MRQVQNGEIYGQYLVLQANMHRDSKSRLKSKIKCLSCGDVKEYRNDNLLKNKNESCRKCRGKVKPGDKFGKRSVIEAYVRRPYKKGMESYHLIRCECGREDFVFADQISKTNHCVDCEKIRVTTHGLLTNYPVLYSRWSGMKARCYNPHSAGYNCYGGRGIVITDSWFDPVAFVEWALANGFKKELSIDRIDVNGNYEPSNCRWVTTKKQNRNKRNTIYVEAFGKRQALADWADEHDITYSKLYGQIKRGVNPEAAITALSPNWSVNSTYEGAGLCIEYIPNK